ncbi:LytTR family DNA-binding domain-containing protein [Brevundimonas faecalis]|uniref:LytTR family DNA-binding domain-containing protein n=1 Tax=Brevundimonas faecalis TaxID=947378 RepID=UPI003607B00B
MAVDALDEGKPTVASGRSASPTDRLGPVWSVWRAEIVTGVVLIAAMTGQGAFDTDQAPWPVRLAYWSLAIGVGGGLSILIARLLPRSPWRAPALFLLMTGAVALWVWGLSSLMLGADPALWRAPHVVGAVAVVNALALGLVWLIRRGLAISGGEAPATADARPMPPVLAARLPYRFRDAQLYALKAEDHYVRFYTDAGEALVRLNFNAALAAVSEWPGRRTHRSWWIAGAAVTRSSRKDGRGRLILKNGVEAPVSRRFAAELRAAGFL